MEHYQVRKPCEICKREIIADIFSVGSGHQTIQALTHLKCAEKAGGTIMKEGEVENLANL